jgi:hypothetical protein
MSTTVQSVVVAAIVLACAWRVLRGFAPRLAWRAQAWVAFGFERPGRPAWVRRIGLWLRPVVPVVTGCGSGASSACSACGSCATPAAVEPAPRAIPLRLV